MDEVKSLEIRSVAKNVANVLTKELGDSGTQRYGGYYFEEPNSLFRDETRIDTIEEMRRMDGTVIAVLNAIKAPVFSTDWRIETESEEEEDQMIAEFVHKQLLEMGDSYGGRTWNEFLREAFNFLDFGHYVFEIVYDVVDGQIILKDLAPRIPRSIQNWKLTDGRFGIVQWIRTDDKTIFNAEIPGDKLLILTNEKEGDDVTGRSVLRAAYKHYKMKDVLYRISAIAAERYGVGIPVVWVPESAGTAEKSEAEEMAKNLRSNQKSFVLFKGKKDDWVFEIKTPNGNPQGAQIDSLIEHHNKQILLSVLANFLGLGTDGVGSFALSKDQSSFFLKHVEDKARYFTEQINKQVIKRLVDINFGKREVYPKLKFSALGDIDFREMSEVLKTLSDGGLIINDGKLKQFSHKMFKLPELTREQIEAIDNEVEPEKPIEESMVEKKKDNFGAFTEREFKPFRALSIQEERVNLRSLNEAFNKNEREIEEEMADITEKEIERLQKEVSGIVEEKNITALDVMKFAGILAIAKLLKRVMKNSYDLGKTTASQEMGITIPSTKKDSVQIMGIDGSDIAIGYGAAVLGSIKNVAKEAISAGVSKEAATAEAIRRGKEEAAKLIMGTSGTVVGKYMNQGRRQVFGDNINKIVGFQRSEVLDDRTCNICLSLDGRVIRSDDPMAKMDLVHSHCRGVWVPIMVSDPEQPKITGIPKTIESQFDKIGGIPTVNSFKQIKKPTNVKGNEVAQKEISKRLNK